MDGETPDNKKNEKKVVKHTVEYYNEELIREAIKNLVKDKIKKRSTNDEIEAMTSTCSEFLKCFVIMGYDFEGNAIKPQFYAKNDLDADALSQYMQKFFVSSIQMP